MKKNKNKQGFTIIEILIVVAIIGILASVVLVSLYTARQKAADLSVFYSIRSAAGPAFACLDSRLENVHLSTMDAGVSICQYIPSSGPNSGIPQDVIGYPKWPDITKNGWDKTFKFLGPVNYASDNGFYWCTIGFSGNTHPTQVSIYNDGITGGSRGSASFCYMLKKDTRYIWCTEEGCRKEGF